MHRVIINPLPSGAASSLDSYRRHLWALGEYEAGPQPEDPIDKLREWSARYGMVNPDDLNLARGGAPMTWKLADGQHDQSLHPAAPTCTT